MLGRATIGAVAQVATAAAAAALERESYDVSMTPSKRFSAAGGISVTKTPKAPGVQKG